ncbi:amino acid adenylation domain-containing protein, partial [Bacillus sp. NPDC077411]|uniref:amino acid adenylation domain-containing protein n=1 Tax=Bacillus sp. NPDC077411 TaxID=3363947 RepID=UPI0037C8E25E
MGKQIKRENVQDILRLTPMQEGLLFHYLSGNESSEYFEQLDINLSGEINIELLEKACNLLAQSNPTLRTVFKWRNIDKPIQIVLKKKDIDFQYHNWIACKKEEQERQINLLKANDKEQGFDLEYVPFRINLCRLGEKEYKLIISYHHIILDGWSIGIVTKELLTYYYKLVQGDMVSPVPKSSFKEFIQYINGIDKEHQKNFWGNYLYQMDNNSISSLNLSTSYTKKIEHIVFSLKENLLNKIKRFTKQEKISLASFFYAAYSILYYKYTNTKDVVFGTTTSGRNIQIDNIDQGVGLFINTTPLRVILEKEQDIVKLLKDVNKLIIDRKDFELTSLAEIANSIGTAPGKLFDSIVVIENYPLEKQIYNNKDVKLSVDSFHIEEETNYNLVVTINTFDDISIDISYNTQVFSREFMEQMAEDFEMILSFIIENKEQTVNDIKLLSKNEEKHLLSILNDTVIEYPKDKTIHKLFEEQVEQSPNRVAVVAGESRLTYQELNERANQLARTLRSKGIGPDTVVAIMTERNTDMLVGLLGILKAGGAYLPIDQKLPKQRIEFMLRDSKTGYILGQEKLLDTVEFEGTKIYLDSESSYHINGHNLEEACMPNNLAYVIYTSGSTGTPKGVMIEHQSVNNFIEGMSNNLQLEKDMRMLSLTSISFDIFVLETIFSLVKGLRVVIASSQQQLDIQELEKLIKENSINIIQSTPSRMRSLLELKNLPNIEKIIIGGEALGKDLVVKIKQLTGAQLYNVYGPTETTIWSTLSEIGSEKTTVNIGKPIANTRIYICNDRELVPIGVAGELCIAGEGLARGYLGNPTLTAEKFVENPFIPGEKMYRTGDLARWLPDGNLEFLGRIDHQVKIRGYRIELGEIEHQLLKHEDVEEVVVMDREDEVGEKYLCGYVVAKRDISVAELRQTLLAELPDYMIPSYFIQLEKFPLNTNGKLDRKVLPTPDWSSMGHVEYVAPRNETEEQLAHLWQEILSLNREVGIHENFFELGGHSLRATSLVSK